MDLRRREVLARARAKTHASPTMRNDKELVLGSRHALLLFPVGARVSINVMAECVRVCVCAILRKSRAMRPHECARVQNSLRAGNQSARCNALKCALHSRDRTR